MPTDFYISEEVENVTEFLDLLIPQQVNISANATNEFGHINFFDKKTSEEIEFLFSGVLLTTVACFGVVGNILSILVLSRKKILHASLTVLLIGLSVCDLFVCILLIFLKGLPILFKYFDIWAQYQFLICVPKKFIFPFLQTVQLGSTYFTVAITVERYIAVFRPLESRSICTFRRAIQVSVAIALFSIISNSVTVYIHILRNEVYHESNHTCQSLPSKNIPAFLPKIRLGIYVIVHILIPLITVLLINTFIVKKIHTNNAARGNFTQNQLKEVKLTNMLIVVVVVYIICNIFRVINSFTTNIFKVTYAELVALTEFLVGVNSAINYLIYCAYGESFRQSFVQMFCQCGKTPTNKFGSQQRRNTDTSDNIVTEMTIIKSTSTLNT